MATFIWSGSGDLQSVLGEQTTTVGEEVNFYGSISALPSTETTLITVNLTAGQQFAIIGFTVWADIDAEWIIKVDGVPKAGTRTTASNLSNNVEWTHYLNVAGPATVTLNGIHTYSASEVLKANLIGRIR